MRCRFSSTPHPRSLAWPERSQCLIFYQSHWVQFVAFAQVVAGLLLLANRFVPVALIILAAFELQLRLPHHGDADGLVAPIVATILWLLVALQYREVFAPVFRAKPTVGR